MDNNFFKDPTTNAEYTISPFWFWNDLITDEKTTEQLNMMNRINAKQPLIHARAGLQNKYLSEDWFERIQSVIDEAKKNDMKIWLYDENNWPSGNCSWTITEKQEYREHFLEMPVTKLLKDEIYTVNINDVPRTRKSEVIVDAKPIEMNVQVVKYINITAYKAGSNEGFDVLSTADNNGEIKFRAECDTDIYTINVATFDYEPIGKLCVDYLNKKPLKEFIEKTHDKYAEHFEEDFGKTIEGIFMDETRLFNPLPWTESFKEEFIARKGYDIVPLLPLLSKKTEKSRFIRYDYFDVVADMMREATFKQVYDWGEENGIKTVGHFLGEETLATQSRFNADMMRQYRYFHIPGIDHLGNGIGSLEAKFCTSAAHNYGRNRICCESFGASGWDIAFEEMVKISNWLFQQGINLIMIHGFYYSIRDERKNDWPPSYFYQWKYWDDMPMYANMAARMTYMLSDGRAESDILVYYPIETFWNYFEPNPKFETCFWKEGPFVKDEKAKFIDNQYQLVCNILLNKNLDFDIFNSDAVENFKVENGKLVNKLTGASFSVFVLPLTEMMTEDVIKLLNEFIAQGGKVISYKSDIKYTVGKNGEHVKGKEFAKLDNSKFINAIKISNIVEECESEIELPFEIVCGIDEVSRTQMSYPDRLIDPYIHDGETQYGVGVTRYIKKDKRILNFTNYNDNDENLTVSVKSTCIPEIYIPETGEIIKVEKFINENDKYDFDFVLPKNRTYFIVCGL